MDHCLIIVAQDLLLYFSGFHHYTELLQTLLMKSSSILCRLVTFILRSVWREYEMWSLQKPPSYMQCPSKVSLATTAVWISVIQSKSRSQTYKKNFVLHCPEALRYAKVWGRDIVRSLTLAYAKRLFPDSNPWPTSHQDRKHIIL